MFPGQMQKIDIATLLEEPEEVEFTFVGGFFDGHKSTATVRAVLTDKVTVVMKRKNRYLYRYAGDHTFK
ncbi:MAG TPA: hypothetical protein VIV60_00140, partial [Polyangiaceae bacterium]